MRGADGEALVVESLPPSGWVPLYRFALEPAELSDYEVANWYTSTHSGSLFTNHLLAERLGPRSARALFDTRLTRRYPDGRAEVSDLATPDALARALDEDLAITPPVDAGALFAKLPTA